MIKYVKGDATNPLKGEEDARFLLHVCNNVGKWGAGFVKAISKEWPQPEQHYRNWFNRDRTLRLGQIQTVYVEDNLYVVNLIGQEGIRSDFDKTPPIRYDALCRGMTTLAEEAYKFGNTFTIHAPRLGNGLAGGDWRIIEAIINVTLIDKGIDVTIYDL